MSSSNQKQVGDRVVITAGPSKDERGVLQSKVARGWNVQLDSGALVMTSFPYVQPCNGALSDKTVVELQVLAKQNGIAVARTKADFLRIIEQVSPGEDLGRLKGRVLFDRVTELHISRLRSKGELVNLLEAK